jgi:KUP system potassium uptake protein
MFAATPSAPRRALALGVLGVVFGDIGTSPLYAFRAAVQVGGDATEATIYGLASLIVWALVVTVTVKYIGVLLRADNKGEGGILSLFALAQQALGRHAPAILLLGVGGAAMFMGDALITPAVSVLSAVEGLQLASPRFTPWVLPLTLIILLLLFALQRRGTGLMGGLFGPVMLLWFATLAAMGLAGIWQHPAILWAINPVYGLDFLLSHGAVALPALGAVFLAVTGAEALYADLGHFGRKPIQQIWTCFVLPALTLNYLGQGALVLARPAAAADPFFHLMPPALLLPLVGLAMLATIIASQAVITGAFSLAQQAVSLGLIPRMAFRHTSFKMSGQIYAPTLNRWMALGVVFLVLGFGSSAALAHAYGLAVAMNMVVTGLLLFMVVWRRWGRPLWQSAALVLPFLLIDGGFLVSNLLKIRDGGWLPLTVAGMLMVTIVTWVKGSHFLYRRTVVSLPPLDRWLRLITREPPPKVPGTAIWLTSDTQHAPSALLHNIKHNHVLHARNIILSVRPADVPRVPSLERVAVTELEQGFWRVTISYGYMERPDIPAALVQAHEHGLPAAPDGPVSYFLARRSLKANGATGMPLWQDRLYINLAKLSEDATDFFKLPPQQVMEIGMQIEL